MFSGGLLLGGHKCLCATSKIRQFTRVILFLVNSDHKFAHGDVSIILDSLGDNDNVVLEFNNVFIMYP